MRFKGVHHVEFSVLEYDESIKFFDKMFGWLGYKSFWTLDIDYRSTYYMARFPFFHSYIGIQPAKTGGKLKSSEHQTGIHHIALWAKNRKEVDLFCENQRFGVLHVTTPSCTTYLPCFLITPCQTFIIIHVYNRCFELGYTFILYKLSYVVGENNRKQLLSIVY